MITAMHALIYSKDADAVRDFLRDKIGLPFVDTGGGWLIFALPPAEVGVHPSEGETRHELCLMCDDVGATVAELCERGMEVRGEPEDLGFGVGTRIVLPGGVEVLLYEPRHPTAI
jgi:catechol 2,3-dioxygenase-like lactoylglutathione lyase family enzyme